MWPGGGPSFGELCDTLQRDGHEIVYVVSEQSEHLIPKGAIYHDHYDAWDGKRAPALTGENIVPVSQADIAARYQLESLALTMMNKHYDRAPVDQRKHTYYEMLSYWIYVFERVQPEGLIFQIIPHSIYNFIALELAREKGLFTYMFEEAVVGGRLLSYRDFRAGNEKLRQRFAYYRKRGVRLEDLDVEIQQYWREHQKESSTQEPWYVRDHRRAATGRGLWRIRAQALLCGIREGTVVRLMSNFIARKLQPGLREEYELVAKVPDLSKPYIYVPLQFQPERTTSPQGEAYHDQILAIETIAASVPSGWEIFVKEHPSQWHLRHKTSYNSVRWRGYYERLSRIPRVRVVPVDTNSYTLIDKAKTVSVVTGTAGWEAIVREKQVLVFGYVWYRDCPGVHRVQSTEDCRRAIARLEHDEVGRNDVLAFLKAYEEVSVHTHMIRSSSAPPVSETEGVRSMIRLILDEMRNL